jgi:hypothetical protein
MINFEAVIVRTSPTDGRLKLRLRALVLAYHLPTLLTSTIVFAHT